MRILHIRQIRYYSIWSSLSLQCFRLSYFASPLILMGKPTNLTNITQYFKRIPVFCLQVYLQYSVCCYCCSKGLALAAHHPLCTQVLEDYQTLWLASIIFLYRKQKNNAGEPQRLIVFKDLSTSASHADRCFETSRCK